MLREKRRTLQHGVELDHDKQREIELAADEAGPPGARGISCTTHTKAKPKENSVMNEVKDHQRTWRDVAAQGVMKKN